MKESLAWKCEQIGGYPLCNCKSELKTTTASTTTQLPTTITATTPTTTQLPTTTTITTPTTSLSQSTSKKQLGSLIGKI
jgi:hypothetical protein